MLSLALRVVHHHNETAKVTVQKGMLKGP